MPARDSSRFLRPVRSCASSRWRAGSTLLLSATFLVAASTAPLLPEATAQEVGGEGAYAPQAEVRTLTLEEALALAATHNPEHRRSVNQLDLNPTASRSAWSALVPSLSLSTNTGASFSQSTREIDFFGNPIENPDPARHYSSSASQSVSLSWSFQGLSPRYELAEARAANRVRDVQLEGSRHRLELEVVRAFFHAQEREELLALEEEMLAGRERDLAAAESLYRLARRDRTDVLGAELEVARQMGQIEEAGGELRKALLALGNVVGAPDLEEVRIEAEPVQVFGPEELDADRLVALALERNARIRQEEAALDEQRAARGSARSARFPQFSVSAGLTRGAFGADQQAFMNLNPRDNRSGSLGFSVSIPLQQSLLSGAHQEQVAEVGVRNQTETLREARMEVEEEVRGRLIDLGTAYRTAELRERERELADERLRLTQEAYGMARRTFDELQTALREAADARRNALSARYEFLRARVDLEEALGVSLNVALAAID